MQHHQHVLVQDIISRHKQRTSKQEVHWLGHKFVIHPTVFSPFIAPSGLVTRAFSSLYDFEGKRVWEVGCGSSVLSCVAALSGANQVVASDISDDAVANSNENVDALAVRNVSVRKGQLFDPLMQDEVFDVIYVDLPLANGHTNSSLEMAFFDHDLNSIKTFSIRAREFLDVRHGEIFVCLSNLEPKTPIINQFKASGFSAERILSIEQLQWITLELYRFKI